VLKWGLVVRRRLGALGAALAVALLEPMARAQESPPEGGTRTAHGADEIISEITDMTFWGWVGTINAYSLGLRVCNIGDMPEDWAGDTDHHPVMVQNMYRLEHGRFEQIGQSWAKHGQDSGAESFCGTCQRPPLWPEQLGVGCSDAYRSRENGYAPELGPRSAVNGTTGALQFPFSAPAAPATIGRRLQVLGSDVDPAQHPGALYFVEGHFVAAGDALADHGLNNAAYRRVSFPAVHAAPRFAGATVGRVPAIQAWAASDPGVVLVRVSYLERSVQPSVTVRFWIAARASRNADGSWHYEYAVYNHNAERAASSFAVPLDPGVVLSHVGFHRVSSHSGEPYRNVDWVTSVRNGAFWWSTPQNWTQDRNTSALRWGTMYNFRFDANRPPRNGAVSLGLFAPGTPMFLSATVPVPDIPVCAADFDHDGVLGPGDLLAYLEAYSRGQPERDLDNNGRIDARDFMEFLSLYSAGCGAEGGAR
jgi:hypothetical protein